MRPRVGALRYRPNPMSEIPQHWPQDAGQTQMVVPLFLLRGVFLLPRQVLPLHVFEPRYRTMIDEVLDVQGRIAIGTLVEGEEAIRQETPDQIEEVRPRFLPVAGIGEIARHEKTPDGRYFIWLFGIGRFQIEEAESDRPYRRVNATPLAEVEPVPEAKPELSRELRDALDSRSTGALGLPENVPIGILADALAQKLHLPQSAMEPIFGETDVERRAQMVLRAHEAFPPPDLG